MMILLIRHSNAPTKFVENLSKVLERAFDRHGKKLTTIIEANLVGAEIFVKHAKDTAEVLVVATDVDIETGWFRENTKTGQMGKVPLIAFFGNVDSGILDAFGNIHFGPTPGASGKAFEDLCRHFDVGPVGDPEVLDSDEYLPESAPPLGLRSSTFYEDLFRQLQTTPTVLLLAQAGRGERAFVKQIRDHALEHYGESSVIDITPPSSLDVEPHDLFTFLGAASGFEGVKRQYEWEQRLKEKIAEEGTVFLLLSRFEHASESSQHSIAKVLRGLSEELDFSSFHIVICGGMRLVEHKFVDGIHSLLNNAHPMLFPDLEVDDLVEWIRREAPLAQLAAEYAELLLERYGSHPGLLRYALGELRNGGRADLDPDFDVMKHRRIWFEQYFVPYSRNKDDAEKVCHYLWKPKTLRQFGFWPGDEVVRRLFWNNLLAKNSEGVLEWRSETIRKAGLEILRCKS